MSRRLVSTPSIPKYSNLASYWKDWAEPTTMNVDTEGVVFSQSL